MHWNMEWIESISFLKTTSWLPAANWNDKKAKNMRQQTNSITHIQRFEFITCTFWNKTSKVFKTKMQWVGWNWRNSISKWNWIEEFDERELKKKTSFISNFIYEKIMDVCGCVLTSVESSFALELEACGATDNVIWCRMRTFKA